MDTDRQTVFLSGTRKDLGPFFLAAQKAIAERLPTYRVVTMDEVTSEDITSERWSRREAATRDLLVGLIGRYFGTVRGEGPSLTEQEYDAAGRAGVHRLMFLTDAGESAVIASQDDAARHRLEEFRARLQASLVCRKVSTSEEFAHEAVRAIQEWERRTLHGLLMSAEQFAGFCEPSSPQGLMSHAHPYLGTGEPGRVLEEFLSSPRRILVVHGPWGRGKTRALLEGCRRQLPLELRFLRPDVMLSHQGLKEVAGEPYALVVEDMHHRSADQQRALLLFLKQRAPEVKLIVTARTNRLQNFEAQLREQRFEKRELQHYEVPLLSDTEQRQLIQTILGRKDEELTYRLARRTHGNALATVLLARRAREGTEDLRKLEGDDFEYSIVKGFLDLLLQQAGGSEERSLHLEEVMKLLAVVGPIRPGDREQLKALERFLACRPGLLAQDLDALEAAGLLSRYGGLVRVPVDAVAEHLVVRASVNAQGESTGYIDQVMDRLAEAFLANILRNLASADWDQERPKRISSVTSGVWHLLPELYERLPFSRRQSLLEAVADIAPLYPRAALSFAEWLLSSKPSLSEDEEPYRRTVENSVRHHVTQLLGRLLDEPSCVVRACDLLWEWAMHESPDSNATPYTAERMLSDAGEYRWTKSIPAYEAFVTWAESRGQGERKIPTPRLAKYLRPLLGHELEHRWSDGKTVTLSAMKLPYAWVESLRKRVIHLLIRLATEGGYEDTQRALVALGEALSEPLGAFNREVTDEERAAWAPEQAYVLERLRSLRAQRRSTVMDLGIREQLDWLVKHASVPAIRASAKELFDELETALTGTLEKALVATDDVDEEYEETLQQLERLDREAAQQLIETRRPPEESLEVLRQVFVALTKAEMHPRIPGVFQEIAQASPEHGVAWSRTLLKQPGHPLRPFVHALARGLLQSVPEEGKALFERILENESPDLLRGLSLRGLGGTVFDGKALAGHLNRMLCHPDAHVRKTAFRQLRVLDEIAPGERGRLLLDYPLAEYPDSVNDWATAIVRNGPYTSYGQAERERLAVQLRNLPKLEHGGLELLERLARDVPAAVVDTLLARLFAPRVDWWEFESYRRHKRENPFLSGLPSAERHRAMYALGELFEHEESRIQSYARRWFSLLGRGDAASVRAVRRCWLESGTPAHIHRALDSFDAAEPEELFEHEGDVIALLRLAASLGPEELASAKSTLTRAAKRGPRSGSPGKPFPRDLAIRDKARSLAARYAPGTLEEGFYRDVADAIDRSIKRRADLEDEEYA